MITVNLPDGSKAQFPDGTPPAAMKAAIQKKFPPQAAAAPAPKPGTPGYAAQAVQNYAQGQDATGNAIDPAAGATAPVPDNMPAWARAFSDHAVNVPILGPALTNARNAIVPALGGQSVQQMNAADQQASQQAPAAALAGDVFGAVAPFAAGGAIPGVAKVLGMDASMPLLGRMAASAGSNAAIMGADALTRGQSLDQAKNAALAGGALGGAAPLVGAGVQKLLQAPVDAITSGIQRRATSAAIANAPSAAELKTAASALFDKVDQAGVTADTPRFSQFVNGMVQNAKKMGVDPTLDPKATAAYQRMIGALQDVQASGAPLTVSNLHTLRQIAQGAAMSTEGRDAMFANQIVKGLDNFIQAPGALSVPGGGNDLLQAISTWSKASRVARIQTAIDEGSNMASGAENGIRLKLLGLLRDKSFTAQLSSAERQALEDAAHGNLALNSARFAGFFGSKLGASMAGIMGAAAGSAFGPGGGAAGAMAGTGIGLAAGAVAKAAAERVRIAAAERAARVFATSGVPQIPRPMVPNVSLPVEAYVRSRGQ